MGSYAHKDSQIVFDFVEKMNKRGYRILYDEGIEPGSEWPENIAEHLIKSDAFIAMITNNSMTSMNCRRELNFAISKNKPFLSVLLEKTDMPPGVELQISAQQSVLKYSYADEERFLKKVEDCPYLYTCHDNL